MKPTLNILRGTLAILKIQLTTVCTFVVFDPYEFKIEIDYHISRIQEIFLQQMPLGQEELEVLREINKYTKIIQQMLRERLSLQSQIRTKLEERNAELLTNITPRDSPGLNDFSSSSSSKPASAKRLAQEQLYFLEKWFEANSAHPYLNTQSLDSLKSQTGLSEIQVRNW